MPYCFGVVDREEFCAAVLLSKDVACGLLTHSISARLEPPNNIGAIRVHSLLLLPRLPQMRQSAKMVTDLLPHPAVRGY